MGNDIDKIIRKYTAFDPVGKSERKIDTYLEYSKLGEFLNGSSRVKKGTDGLTSSQIDELLKLYNNAKEFITKKFINKNKIIEINTENVEEYLRFHEEMYCKDNREELSESELKEFDALKKGLYKFCLASQYDLDTEHPDEYKELNYSFVIDRILKRNKLEADMIEKGQVVLDRIKNRYDNDLLKDAVKKKITDENIPNLGTQNSSIDLGNGNFDKTATQKTELCWAHAGINSLLLTKEGKSLLNSNIYYDKETGVIGIHLQEADDNGLHDGIYIITTEEIEAEGKILSSGDGDVTAWMIAINRYFKEMQQDPELMNEAKKKGQIILDVDKGNTQCRFFEIITGAQSSRKDLFDRTRLQVGVSYGQNDVQFEDIKDLVLNEKGAAIITFNNHAMSVVGIKGDSLLIQESNQHENLDELYFDEDRNHVIFSKTEPIDGVPTYKVSAYDFEHYGNFHEAVIKWR